MAVLAKVGQAIRWFGKVSSLGQLLDVNATRVARLMFHRALNYVSLTVICLFVIAFMLQYNFQLYICLPYAASSDGQLQWRSQKFVMEGVLAPSFPLYSPISPSTPFP